MDWISRRYPSLGSGVPYGLGLGQQFRGHAHGRHRRPFAVWPAAGRVGIRRLGQALSTSPESEPRVVGRVQRQGVSLQPTSTQARPDAGERGGLEPRRLLHLVQLDGRERSLFSNPSPDAISISSSPCTVAQRMPELKDVISSHKLDLSCLSEIDSFNWLFADPVGGVATRR
jgi:hypothetical protein